MWEEVSLASWMMSSARSVSKALIPWRSRCSLSLVSSVAMDLTFTTSVASWLFAIPAMMRFASAASRPVDLSSGLYHGLLELQEVLIEMAHDPGL